MTQASDSRKQRHEAEKLLKTTGIRTFEVLQYVSGPLEGDINDWPSHIQDTIYKAMERKALEVQLPLALVLSYCDEDIDSDDPNRRFFIRVIASEIIAVDMGATRH